MHGRPVDPIPDRRRARTRRRGGVAYRLSCPAAVSRRSGTVEGVGRIGIMLAVALPLAAADLAREGAASRPSRGPTTSARSVGSRSRVALLAGMLVVARIPSALVAPARASSPVACSATASPPPGTAWRCQTPSSSAAGTPSSRSTSPMSGRSPASSSLVCAIGVWLIRNRDLLPPPAERARRRADGAFRRLFEDDSGETWTIP